MICHFDPTEKRDQGERQQQHNNSTCRHKKSISTYRNQPKLQSTVIIVCLIRCNISWCLCSADCGFWCDEIRLLAIKNTQHDTTQQTKAVSTQITSSNQQSNVTIIFISILSVYLRVSGSKGRVSGCLSRLFRSVVGQHNKKKVRKKKPQSASRRDLTPKPRPSPC